MCGEKRNEKGPGRIAPRAGLGYLQQSPQPLGQQVVQEPSLQQSPQADFSCEVWAKAVTARTRTSESIAMVRFIGISLTLNCRIQIVPRDGWSQGASFAWDARRGLDPEDAEQDVSLEPGWNGRAGLTNGRTCERAGQGERREQNCDGEHKLGLGRF
jgi:hypothetical protein